MKHPHPNASPPPPRFATVTNPCILTRCVAPCSTPVSASWRTAAERAGRLLWGTCDGARWDADGRWWAVLAAAEEEAATAKQWQASEERTTCSTDRTWDSALSAAPLQAPNTNYTRTSSQNNQTITRKLGIERVQACILANILRLRYVAIATQPVHRLQIRPIVHN